MGEARTREQFAYMTTKFQWLFTVQLTAFIVLDVIARNDCSPSLVHELLGSCKRTGHEDANCSTSSSIGFSREQASVSEMAHTDVAVRGTSEEGTVPRHWSANGRSSRLDLRPSRRRPERCRRCRATPPIRLGHGGLPIGGGAGLFLVTAAAFSPASSGADT